MRKLKPTEVTALVAALTIGSGNVEAAETTVIATVTVTASRININVSPRFILPIGYISGGGSPTQAGTTSTTLQAHHRHAIQCAATYGNSRGAVPKHGWLTYFSVNYGWENNLNVYSTVTDTPPGPGWNRVYGITTPLSGPFILGKTQIFLNNHTDTGDLINTIAHEWAHQWGPLVYSEAQAAAVGDNVEAAWLADAGRLCGGL